MRSSSKFIMSSESSFGSLDGLVSGGVVDDPARRLMTKFKVLSSLFLSFFSYNVIIFASTNQQVRLQMKTYDVNFNVTINDIVLFNFQGTIIWASIDNFCVVPLFFIMQTRESFSRLQKFHKYFDFIKFFN